ncbi:uncharacterized protein DUF4148 [Paraburkholderia sp. BL6665CI2N2]|uniref:DUF4148 domain-containing protein n=1 Tax=Paraburkholderia sp. BL6665CI2N2 TaxID=1938806 RepID=UPI001066B08C|nr:DUF4148 domain-containing protein [Paraburkholderia sp. BL6665CI2N2]TDY22913.1 uncharacterized protein DUF4148 [Paraburkholderia sp. BL6665CI2N2]
MKKAIVCIALAAAALSAPVLSFAQSNGPVTRAEVRSDLVQLERTGYNPARSDDASYPADIQTAEAKVAAQSTHQQTQSYGGVPANGTSSGGPAHTAMQSTCIGPASFCTPYFGK